MVYKGQYWGLNYIGRAYYHDFDWILRLYLEKRQEYLWVTGFSDFFSSYLVNCAFLRVTHISSINFSVVLGWAFSLYQFSHDQCTKIVGQRTGVCQCYIDSTSSNKLLNYKQYLLACFMQNSVWKKLLYFPCICCSTIVVLQLQ